MTVTLDSPKGRPARVVSFIVGGNAEAGEFNALRHALAGTVWKEQGKTKTETLALHSDHWRSASSYVALSRFTDNVHIFATEKPAPWIMATGGIDALNEKQRAGAEQSYTAWAEAKPDLAKKYGLADYVAYVQAQWIDEKRFDPLDRLARQMSRVEERRAASEFTRGARPQNPPQEPQQPQETRHQAQPAAEAAAPEPMPDAARDEPQRAPRKPTLSIIAGIVGDYLKLCYDPAIDWVRWVAEDLRYRAAARLGASPQQGRDDVHTEGTGAALEDADRIRRHALHELQGGMDADGQGGGGVDGLPARPGADHAGDDGLRPLRDAGGIEAPTDTEDSPGGDYIRERLAEAARETAKRDEAEPQAASDYLRERGRFRGRGRDR
jgi:hypothetical protein